MKHRGLIFAIVCGLSQYSVLAEEPKHSTEEIGTGVTSVRKPDGTRWESETRATAHHAVESLFPILPDRDLDSRSVDAAANDQQNLSINLPSEDSLALQEIRQSQVNLARVFKLPPNTTANDTLHQVAQGNGFVMSDLLRKLSQPELHSLYNRLDGMDKTKAFMYEDQKSLLKYMRTMRDEKGRFDPEGASTRNKLNLINALNLPNDASGNDTLDKIAHDNSPVISSLLGKIDNARRDKLFNELARMENSGQFMYEDQKALLRYMKSH